MLRYHAAMPSMLALGTCVHLSMPSHTFWIPCCVCCRDTHIDVDPAAVSAAQDDVEQAATYEALRAWVHNVSGFVSLSAWWQPHAQCLTLSMCAENSGSSHIPWQVQDSHTCVCLSIGKGAAASEAY